MKREIKISFMLALVSILCVCNSKAEIIWDSGHHVYSEGEETWVYMYNDASADIIGGTIWEFYMYNSTTADISGGYVSILWGQDISSVDIYAGSDIGLLRPNDSSTANVYGGEINSLFTLGDSNINIHEAALNFVAAVDLSQINLYVQSYEWDPTGGTWGDGLLTGKWLESGNSFRIEIIDVDSITHINFVPEPGTFLILMIGSVGILYKRATKQNKKL